MIVAIMAVVLCAALLLFGYRLLTARRARLATAQTGTSRSVALLADNEPKNTPGYTHRRMVVSIGLLAFLLAALLIQTVPALSGTFQDVTDRLGLTMQDNSSANEIRPMAHPEPTTASSRVKRISVHAADQFDTQYQLEDWGPSACSGITMTVVMNAYGHSVRVVDVIKKELDLGVWDHNLGLLREDGFRLTADTFGFNTDVSHTRSLEEVIDIANKGTPVIVGVFDYAHFPTGHFIVVSGGDNQYVNVADSSDFNFQHMTHDLFLSMWQHASIILTPKS